MSVSPTKIRPSFFLHLFFILLLFSSCTIVRKYKSNKPFVFANEIAFTGKDIPPDKKELKARLETQIEDSVKPQFKSSWFIRSVLNKPPVFDSNYVKQSVLNMTNLLHNIGYFRSEVTADWSRIDTVADKPDQLRMKVVYNVNTNRLFHIDTIIYSFRDTTLQELAMNNSKGALLKKSNDFNRQLVDDELNRLVDIFRDNGYFRINREMIKAELDTVDISLIDPTADPFEFIRLQVEAQKRIQDPKISVNILQVPVKDSTITTLYKVGNVSIFPDEPVELLQGGRAGIKMVKQGDYRIYSRYNLFKPSFLVKRVALKPGDLYRVSNYNRTLLNFNRIEAWQNVNIVSRPRDSLGEALADFYIRMVPAKKYAFSIDFEGSSILSAQNQLYNAGNKGLAINFQLKNRNVAKQALQLQNTLRTGVEFTDFSKILSSEISLSNKLIFPYLLTPFKIRDEKKLVNAKSFITLDGSYIDRYKYYKINTVNAYIGYEFQRNADAGWQVRFPNIEYTRIYDKGEGFQQLLDDYPLLRYSYNDGLIIGINATYTRRLNPANPRSFGIIRVYGEESGLILGELFKSLTASGKALQDLYRFIKLSTDYRHYLTGPKTSWAFRFFAGYGVGFKTESRNDNDISLPFFRQFFAGGPNSMRGWRLRKLGPGSSIFYDTLRVRSYNDTTLVEKRFDDRYADIQLEANIEYRFDIFPVYGYWLKGALFTDIGNVWVRKSADPEFKYGVFKANRLYADIAVAGGAGLRLDFRYFLLRFDLGWRLKDPLYASDAHIQPTDDGWFIKSNMRTPTFQFGIGYPF
ncbi:MAG: BamA/TamA family outer membrane protein [Terrimonas sp.]|nr:BamA/TamA family outer membrane protein [Terrimonas sp.]